MRKVWPLIATLVLLVVAIFHLYSLITKETDGRVVYALDDAYIHMAIAKNFSQHSVWGITRYEYSSSSSAPLWTLLLSGIYFLFGVNEISPLILNVVFALLSVFLLYFLLVRLRPTPKPVYVFLALLAVVFTITLPVLFIGMESILFALFAILFAHHAARLAHEEDDGSKVLVLLALSFLIALTRYEGFFLIFAVVALFVLNKKWKVAVLVVLAGIIPPVVYGLISLSHGLFFLPETVAIKGGSFDLTSPITYLHLAGYNFFIGLFQGNDVNLLLLLVFATMVFMLGKDDSPDRDYKSNFFRIFMLTAILHIQFSSFGTPYGFYFRYEDYIVALGLIVIFYYLYELIPDKASLVLELAPKYAAAMLFTVLMLFGFTTFVLESYAYTPKAVHNIYEQQYQMGLFLNKYYENKTVVLNDIGAANFLADIRCIDIVGLGSADVARERMKHLTANPVLYKYMPELLNAEQATRLTQQADIAIIYDTWLTAIPQTWAKYAEWKIHDQVVDGNCVSFYAIKPQNIETLLQNVEEYRLPKGADLFVE